MSDDVDISVITSRDLLPLRMLNEYAYCPRLFHFMHVEGRWEDNHYTLEGKEAHRRVDKTDQPLPDLPSDGSLAGDDPPRIARSVPLGSVMLGLTAKLDLVEADGDTATPVETKRGRVPDNPERSWEPERVQLMAQGLLLREQGYKCDHGVLYFAGSRTRVEILLTPELEARTVELLEAAHVAIRSRVLPPPLEDSPKCNGCSLSGICLPDETLALRELGQAVQGDTEPAESADEDDEGRIRRLFAPGTDALPCYVQEQGARVGKSGKQLVISKRGETLAKVRLKDVSQLVLMGNVGISAQTTHLLCEAGVPVVHLSTGNWFYGITHGITLRNAYDRAAQYAAAADPARSLEFAKRLVFGKCANQRTLLGRNVSPRPESTLKEMAMLQRRVPEASGVDELLGLEGGVAAKYFGGFNGMLKPRDFDANWAFNSRNRRPPIDPVNAMLSFGYALLSKECTVALLAEGLDPWWGLYHKPRHGRPALALDLMEEFRPLIVDSAVISAVNTGMVSVSSFERTSSACMLNPSGRKDFIRAYEARMSQQITHPLFGYKCTWRTVVRLQARLFSRWLRGDVPEYTAVQTR